MQNLKWQVVIGHSAGHDVGGGGNSSAQWSLVIYFETVLQRSNCLSAGEEMFKEWQLLHKDCCQ